MRLAEPDAGMDVERVIGRRAGRRRRDPLGGGESERVRLADDEALESHAPVEQRAAGVHGVALAGQGGGRSGSDLRQWCGRADLGRTCPLRRQVQAGLAALPRHLAHREGDAVWRIELGHAVCPQALGIMGFQPALQEAGRYGEMGDALDDRADLDASEPA
jgi:hypothetical protein